MYSLYSQQLATGNQQLAYTQTGSGFPVVLLHGFGEDGSIFNAQVEALKDQFQLIVPSLPATGASVIDFNHCPDTVEFMATAILGLLDHLKINKCVMLGHSMGGYITLAFAEMYPERLQAFGLIHSTAFADSDEKKIVRHRGIDIIKEYGAASFLRTTFLNLFSTAWKAAHAEELNELINRFSYISTEACTYYYHAMINRTDKTAMLKSTSLPVLFVIGEEDIAAPMADVLQQVHLPEKSYVHILPHIGHMSMIESPNKLNEILSAFLEDINM